VDKRRGKVWTKISKAIIVAAKHGGGDPDANLTLRYAIDEARYANMPRDTIERAIKKGAGGGETANYENNRYECYGPGGVAIIVDALTDNRTRTITDLRTAFGDHGGNVGSTGCVAYLFQPRGQILVDGGGVSEDKIMEVAIEAGALDAQPPEDDESPTWTILTEVPAFNTVKDRIEKAGLTITQAELAMIPDTLVTVRGEQAKQLLELVDAVEDLDDVQKVYTNADIPDEDLG
jgi:YebC/PmpR family DNA-binding regulatory protein